MPELNAKNPEKNIKWHHLTIDRNKLEMMRGHKGIVLWFTGLSGSGKSTLANALNEALHIKGLSTFLLDGDNIRHGLCKDLGFSDKDREESANKIKVSFSGKVNILCFYVRLNFAIIKGIVYSFTQFGFRF